MSGSSQNTIRQLDAKLSQLDMNSSKSNTTVNDATNNNLSKNKGINPIQKMINLLNQ